MCHKNGFVPCWKNLQGHHLTISSNNCKLNLIRIISINFQLTKMLLSTIIKNRPLFVQLCGFNFTQQAYPQTDPLNNQIMQTKTWNEFYSLFSKNKNRFTQDTLTLSNRYITQLLFKERETKYSEINQIIAVISQFDLSTMTGVNIVSTLACLRAFCIKGIQINTIFKLKNKFCGRYMELLADKPQGKQNFSEMIYAYYEMAYFGWLPGSQSISERILTRINNQGQNNNLLTLNQANFLLNALATKGDLNNSQRRIRIYILKTLANKLELLKFNELVHSIVSLNKMDFYDATKFQLTNVKILGTRMLENITELDEKQVFQFLKGENNNQHPVFYKIYEQIIKNTYTEIQQDGNTSFDRKTILRLLSSLSARYSFNKHSEIVKNKFYNFLKTTVKQFTQENDTQGIRLLHSCIEELVRNRYFEQSKGSQLVQVLVASSQPVRENLLEALYYNRIDISKLLPDVLPKSSSQNFSVISAIRYNTLFKKISKDAKSSDGSNSIQKYLSSLKNKVEEIFESPQKFAQNFLYVFRNSPRELNFKFVHDTHQEYFQKLVNPFQEEQSSFSFQYKLAYLQYVVQAFRTRDFYNFLNKYSQKIDNSFVVKVIHSNINENNRKISPNKFVITLVLKKLRPAFESKQKELLSASLQLISKYSRFVVSSNRDFQVAKNIIKIININISRIATLKQCGLDKILFSQLFKYITRGNGSYKNEGIYRDILTHSLKVIDSLPLYLSIQVIKQAIRLNIVEKTHIERLQLSKITTFNFSQKEMLQYILDNKFTPEVKEIRYGNLQAILFNHNLNSVIEQRQSEINQILQKTSVTDLFGYLALINQPRSSRAVSRIVTKIVNLINSSEFSIQRCDFPGAFKNLIDKGLNSTRGCKELAEKVVNLLTNKMTKFSTWTHLQVIRFVITIPKLNPREYYNKLIAHTEKNLSDEVEQVIFRLAFTNYDFQPKDLKYVKSLLKKSTFKATYVFLATESLHSQAERKQIVTEIATRLGEIKENENSINVVQYDYLKRVYPEQTKSLELKPQQLQRNTYTTKPRPKIIEVFQQIAKVHQTTVQSLTFYDNQIVKIKNVCIVFFNQKRTGSFHEHLFLKNALSLHFKEQKYQFVFLGYTKLTKLTENIQKQVSDFITPEVNQAVSEYLEKNKPEKEEEIFDQLKSNPEKVENQQQPERKRRQPRNKIQNDQ